VLAVDGYADLAATPPMMMMPPSAPPAQQFMSTVQLAVHEASPELLRRSQKLVREQFADVFAIEPEFEGRKFDVHTSGNEVVFSVVTADDVRPQMQQAVASMIQRLNGRVQARGRSMFYRTSLSPQMSGYLEVVVDDTHSKVRTIQAQGVPLRDLLKEIRFQLGSLSYLIPGECAQRPVDWSFGEEGGPPTQPKAVDALMSELATLFGLKCEKRNGTYIFTGSCNEFRNMRPRTASPGELLRNGFAPMPPKAPPQTQVYFPLLPLE
jgi:hypothetical protein